MKRKRPAKKTHRYNAYGIVSGPTVHVPLRSFLLWCAQRRVLWNGTAKGSYRYTVFVHLKRTWTKRFPAQSGLCFASEQDISLWAGGSLHSRTWSVSSHVQYGPESFSTFFSVSLILEPYCQAFCFGIRCRLDLRRSICRHALTWVCDLAKSSKISTSKPPFVFVLH